MRRSRCVAPMKIAKFGYIFISILMCIAGILLMFIPEISEVLLSTFCGVLMIVFGLIRLIGYFSKDLYRLVFQYDLALGIILISLGILTLVNPGSLMNFICITLGLFILADSLFKIQIALDSKTFGIRAWWLILLFGILTGLFGLILMFRPGESSRVLSVLLGITLLFEGSLNISTVLTAVKIIKHQQPDIIDVEYYEEGDD